MILNFELWYQAEYARLVNTLAMVTGDRSLAADAAAEACTKALSRWNRVGAMERPGGWVYRVALNEARRRAKRRSTEGRLLAQSAADTEVTEPPVDGDLDLWSAVARLPERTKEAVVLRYVADLTEPEIGKALGVSRGTVATMLRRAHAKLAEDLGPDRFPEPAPTQELLDVYNR
ncbi:MAG: sigma-70 family RNA polymerase sigma factor [Actinomycetota bacterium]